MYYKRMRTPGPLRFGRAYLPFLVDDPSGTNECEGEGNSVRELMDLAFLFDAHA
jgi:hypothetical protein